MYDVIGDVKLRNNDYNLDVWSVWNKLCLDLHHSPDFVQDRDFPI